MPSSLGIGASGPVSELSRTWNKMALIALI
jgi:hypothetical protein